MITRTLLYHNTQNKGSSNEIEPNGWKVQNGSQRNGVEKKWHLKVSTVVIIMVDRLRGL